jgi:hypothetical protein
MATTLIAGRVKSLKTQMKWFCDSQEGVEM